MPPESLNPGISLGQGASIDLDNGWAFLHPTCVTHVVSCWLQTPGGLAEKGRLGDKIGDHRVKMSVGAVRQQHPPRFEYA